MVGPYPSLCTRRFRLRPFVLSDIRPLVSIAGEHRIADTTIGVPYPYTNDFARMWISSHAAEWKTRRALHWAVTGESDAAVVGYAGLNKIDNERHQAELRFWVGRGIEHHGHACEWSEALLEYAVSSLELSRVYALQLARHPLAGRVLASIGMQREAMSRKRIYKEGLMEDVVVWSILDQEWRAVRMRGSNYYPTPTVESSLGGDRPLTG